jgi:transposase
MAMLGQDAFPGQGRLPDEEMAALKRELAHVKKERDCLKEAAAYFARLSKESTPVSISYATLIRCA